MFQSTRELTITKLIVLYLIDKMKIPLSNTQITQFVLERNLTDYFCIQQYLLELVEAKLLDQKEEDHTTRYKISEQGRKTLQYFITHIPDSVRQEINLFIEKNRKQVKQEIEVTAHYIPEKMNEFIVFCAVKENDTTLIDLKVSVVTKEQAKLICDNWKKNAQTLYGSILSSLVNKASERK